MCLFKRKKKETIQSKYKINQRVSFRHADYNEILIGYIVDIKKDENGNILYDIQVGGECPFVKKDVKENNIFL